MCTVSHADPGTMSSLRQDCLLRYWLEYVGLRFDPFGPLDAAVDLRLSEYLVDHGAFSQVWGDWVSWLFAPPGGGKTALRRRTAQACWVGQEINRPFPVTYVPPFLHWGHVLPTLDDHLVALAQSGAATLFLALAHRPHWVFRLSSQARQDIRETLEWNLPGPLDGYLDRCRQAKSLEPLRQALNPTFALSDPPDDAALLRWCDTLSKISTTTSSPSPAVKWRALCDLILNTLGFRTIYVLVDGLDAAPETNAEPQATIQALSPLIPLVSDWADRRIFFKGFLPADVEPLVSNISANVATIRWHPIQLAEVIRRRVYVASEGAFGSMDAITSPALRDVEMTLAEASLPLPREILVLTHRVLQEHVIREGIDGRIQEDDIEAALEWYDQHRPVINIP